MPDTLDYPETWRFDEDGLTAAGTYMRMDTGPSAYGQKPILVLEINSQARSLWIVQEALRSRLADELARRRAREFSVGERIEISRGAEKKLSENDREYWPFKVSFPDAPRQDAADLLGRTEPAAADSESAPLVVQDDIPF